MPAGLTVAELKRALTQRLRQHDIERPDMEARLLLEHITGLSATDMIVNSDNDVDPKHMAGLEALVTRRLSGEPIDHIFGYKDFYGRRFIISDQVLSPRPETEGVVDESLKCIKNIERPTILELGVGSGAIIVTLLAERPSSQGTGVDISEAAVEIARQNGSGFDVMDRLEILHSDWFENVTGQFDLIVSNPPYITHAAMGKLSQEVKGFDPDIALRGGPDGLDPYRHILKRVKHYLKPEGSIVFEIGYDQGQSVKALCRDTGFDSVRCVQDLSGQDRVIIAMSAKNVSHK